MQDRDKMFIICAFCLCITMGAMIFMFKSIERIGHESLNYIQVSNSDVVRISDMDDAYRVMYEKCSIGRDMPMAVALRRISKCLPELEHKAKKEEVEAIIQSMIEAKGVEMHRNNKVYTFGIIKVADETNPKFLSTNIK